MRSSSLTAYSVEKLFAASVNQNILIRLNCPEYFIGFRFNWKHGFFNDILHHVVMDKQTKLVPLTTLHDSRVVESARR